MDRYGATAWKKGMQKAVHVTQRQKVRAIDETVEEFGNTDLKNTTAYVNSWPSWKSGPNPRKYRLADGLTKLSAKRNAFTFYDGELPPSP